MKKTILTTFFLAVLASGAFADNIKFQNFLEKGKKVYITRWCTDKFQMTKLTNALSVGAFHYVIQVKDLSECYDGNIDERGYSIEVNADKVIYSFTNFDGVLLNIWEGYLSNGVVVYFLRAEQKYGM